MSYSQLYICTYRLQKHLEPLAIAANVVQADNARLDTVLMTLGSLYGTLSQSSLFDGPVREQLTKSLEKRWAQADREVFILAVVLNPYLRTAYFNRRNPGLTEGALWNMLKHVCQYMMGKEPTFTLIEVFTNYLHCIGWYSDEAMALAEIKAATQYAVCPTLLICID